MRLSPLPPQPAAAIYIPDDVPVYRIKEGKFFGPNDHLYEENDVIEFHGEPNLEMEPMNPLAKDKMREFLAKLDAEGRQAAVKAGRAYHGFLDAFEGKEAARTIAAEKGIRKLSQKESVPVLGQQKENIMVTKKLEPSAISAQMPKAAVKGKFSLDKNAVGKGVVNKAISAMSGDE